MSQDAPRYGETKEAPKLRPGTKFLRALGPGELWAAHPSGDGIVIAHPERPMLWVHVIDGDVVEEVIQPAMV
jgi:hypothetical protein